MSKAHDKALKLFTKESSSNFQEAFELKESNNQSEFMEKFLISPLTGQEDRKIQFILQEMSYPSSSIDSQVESDYKALYNIITQIKAINQQGVLLHGERIHQAKVILKKYKDGAFTKWLELAYGNRQTPYRMLQYYEFFRTLESDVQQLMQSMPKKAAYVLASRDGDRHKKIELIREYHSRPSEHIIQMVQETFPLSKEDCRKGKEEDVVLVNSIQADLMRLKKKNDISNEALEKLNVLRELMEEIFVQQKLGQ